MINLQNNTNYQSPYFNEIVITKDSSDKKNSGKVTYDGNKHLNDVIVDPGGKLSIVGNVVAKNTKAVATSNPGLGKGAYIYVRGNAKSIDAEINNHAYLNVGTTKYNAANSESLVKGAIAEAINTHLNKGGVLWTGLQSKTEGTLNKGGVLNEYYGSINKSKNTDHGREYTYKHAISSGSTFNNSDDFVGSEKYKGSTPIIEGGIQNNVTATNHSYISSANSGVINGLSSTNSRVAALSGGTINKINATNSVIVIKHNGVASQIIAHGSVINNNNILDQNNTLVKSTLNMNKGSFAKTVSLNQSTINVNGNSTVNTITSDNNKNIIAFTSNKPTVLTSNTITGDTTVHLSSDLNNFSTDVINVKHGINGHFNLVFSGLSKAGRNTVGNGIEIINNNGYKSNYHVTMTKPIHRGILVYNLRSVGSNDYLQSSLNKVNYINVYTPSALSNYALSNVGSLYQRQGSFVNDSKHDAWVKFTPETQTVNQGKLSSKTLTLGYTFYHNKKNNIDSGLMLNLGKLDFSYYGQTNDTNTFSLYNYTTIKKQHYYFDFVNGFGLYKSKINPTISDKNESFSSKVFTSSIESGYIFKYKKVNIIPQAQLIYQNWSQGSYTLAGYESDTKMNSVKQNNLIGRVGININRNFQGKYLYQPFIQLSIYDKFNKSKNITATDINVGQYAKVKEDKTWLNGIIGLNVKVSEKSNFYAEAIYDHKKVTGLVGYRYSF